MADFELVYSSRRQTPLVSRPGLETWPVAHGLEAARVRWDIAIDPGSNTPRWCQLLLVSLK